MNNQKIALSQLLSSTFQDALVATVLDSRQTVTAEEAHQVHRRLETLTLQTRLDEADPGDVAALADFLAADGLWPGRLAVLGEREALDGVYRSLIAQQTDGPERQLLRRVERRHGPVLLEGPTGSGKTALARQVHRQIGLLRSGGAPFLPVNVAAVRADDLESRMRGLTVGAYTNVGALEGWFEQADGGVLFLDEFQEASPEFQAQFLDLLSATSDRVTVARRGPNATARSFQVRTVMAVNEPVEDLLARGRLRPDFLYRVRVRHQLRGLGERMASMAPGLRLTWLRKLLAAKGWVEQAEVARSPGALPPLVTLTESAANWLAERDWPGNYRELERLLADAAEVAALGWSGDTPAAAVDVHGLEDALQGHGLTRRGGEPADVSIPALAARAMATALRRHEFHLGRAAEDCAVLGMKSQPKFVAMLRELADHLPPDVLEHPKVAARIAPR